MNREMYWADIVPLGTFATWACEPNNSLAELEAMVDKVTRLYCNHAAHAAYGYKVCPVCSPVDGEGTGHG